MCTHTDMLFLSILASQGTQGPGGDGPLNNAPESTREARGRFCPPRTRRGTYLLNRRMAMTMSMMRMTARTGPVTHSISGSSCC